MLTSNHLRKNHTHAVNQLRTLKLSQNIVLRFGGKYLLNDQHVTIYLHFFHLHMIILKVVSDGKHPLTSRNQYIMSPAFSLNPDRGEKGPQCYPWLEKMQANVAYGMCLMFTCPIAWIHLILSFFMVYWTILSSCV